MTANRQELCFLTIAEAGELIRQRKLSPVELTKAFLNRRCVALNLEIFRFRDLDVESSIPKRESNCTS